MAFTGSASPTVSHPQDQRTLRPKATPEEPPEITIHQFEPQDLDAVLTLFKDGMMFYTEPSHPHYQVWVNYVRNSLATDLADIQGFYLNTKGSNFFIATMKDASPGAPVVVGTIAIEKKSEELAELRRVSVKAERRRFGIGKLLMNHATQWAKDYKYKTLTKDYKYKTLTLSTAATQHLAIKFYESLGYKFMTTRVVCNDPHFELTQFEKQI